MAFAAVAAIIAGAEVTATLVITAIGEIGLATTIVGAVTGDKNLMKIGGVMALASGIGGLMEGAASEAAAGAGEWVSAEGGAAYSGGAAVDATATASAVDLGGTESYALDATTGANPVAAQPPTAVPEATPIADPASASASSNINNVELNGNGPISQQQASPTATPDATPGPNTAYERGVVAPSTPAENMVQTPAGEPAKYADWHGDPAYSATPWQQAKGAGYASWDTNMGQAVKTSTFLDKVTAVGDWIESHKMATYLGGQMIKGIAEERQANRLYGLKRDALALDQEKQYNSSHTTRMRYAPPGIVNSQRA